MTHFNPAAFRIHIISRLLILVPIIALSQNLKPTKTMTETFQLSSDLTPWASGGLLAQVKLEVTHTADPLEFILYISNENKSKITFPLDPGSIRLKFRNAVNAPIPTPPIELPMDMPSDALDPNSRRVEYYIVNEDGSKGKRFREQTVSLAPNQSIKVAIKMGPEVMKQLNAIVKMQSAPSSEVKLGVWALVSILQVGNKDFYGRFRTEEALFFPYQLSESSD